MVNAAHQNAGDHHANLHEGNPDDVLDGPHGYQPRLISKVAARGVNRARETERAKDAFSVNLFK